MFNPDKNDVIFSVDGVLNETISNFNNIRKIQDYASIKHIFAEIKKENKEDNSLDVVDVIKNSERFKCIVERMHKKI